jgi:glycosyltransferase involved in cell wall biosynthesis
MNRGELSVVHVAKDVFPPVTDGIARHIDDLRRSMPDVASNVLVGARQRRTTLLRVGTGVEVRVGERMPRILSAPVTPTLPLWLAQIDADIVHVHTPNPMGEIAGLMQRGRRPLVVSHHADIVRQKAFLPLYRPITQRLLNLAAAIVVGSEHFASTSPFLDAFRDKVTIIPYAVDTDAFDPDRVSSEDVQEIREMYGTPLVVATGRLVYYKGLEHLIAAMRELDASLVIVGTGPLESPLKSLAADARRVHFAGWVQSDRLPAMLAAADCFVLASTSRAESFGIATLEAQAMGVPAIVTDVGTGTIDAISPGESGLVVPPRDPAALREALNELLGDDERRRGMGQRARALVLERNSSERVARRFLSLYRRVLDDSASNSRNLERLR